MPPRRRSNAARLAAIAILAAALGGCGEEQGKPAAATAPATAPPAAPAPAAPAAAAPSPMPPRPAPPRWYGPEQVQRGAQVFARNCAVCHGERAQGVGDWTRRDASGYFPPPPLDGSAHAWHHPIAALVQQIKFGAPGGKGIMPRFEKILTDEQVLEAIAWFQHLWPDDVYAAWHDIEVSSRARQ